MNARGFSLVEVTVALLLLATATVAALGLALGGFAATAESRRTELATAMAADLAGRIRMLGEIDWENLPAPGTCLPHCEAPELAALEFAAWQGALAAALPGAQAWLEGGAEAWLLTLEWDETGDRRRELRWGMAR